ncbi:hypothetical protein [Streptomyces sp. SID1121]|uniref:hypothetical protein n=1 Tax=Streptomyces sp. SID1121 TaxID=3425888 RepID=UPI004057201F
MDARTRQLKASWIPFTGFQLRKAGVQFDAVRVDGDDGRRLADAIEAITAGDPGPIVAEANGRRAVYFYLPPGSTALRAWPSKVTRFNSSYGHVSYVPVPALKGDTWPLSWYVPPTGPDRFVHPLLLLNTAALLLGDGVTACQWGDRATDPS